MNISLLCIKLMTILNLSYTLDHRDQISNTIIHQRSIPGPRIDH